MVCFSKVHMIQLIHLLFVQRFVLLKESISYYFVMSIESVVALPSFVSVLFIPKNSFIASFDGNDIDTLRYKVLFNPLPVIPSRGPNGTLTSSPFTFSNICLWYAHPDKSNTTAKSPISAFLMIHPLCIFNPLSETRSGKVAIVHQLLPVWYEEVTPRLDCVVSK